MAARGFTSVRAVAAVTCATALWGAPGHTQPTASAGATSSTGTSAASVTAVTAPAPAAAGNATAATVTISELVAQYLQQNRDLKRAESLIDLAEADVQSARRLDEWTVSGALHWTSRKRGFVANNPFQNIGETSGSAQTTLARSFATGGTLAITASAGLASLDFAVLDQSGGRLDVAARSANAALTANYKQPLLAGRGELVARAERVRAQLAASQAALNKRALAEQAVEGLLQSYWELWFAQQQKLIAEASLALANEQLRISKISVEKRVAAPSDITVVTLAAARREQAVLVASAAIADHSIALRRLIGLPLDAAQVELTVADGSGTMNQPSASGDPLTEAPPTVVEAASLASAQNAQVLAARQGISLGEIDRTVARDRVGSRLDLDVTIGPDAQGNSFGNAMSQIGKGEAYVAMAGLTFSHSLGANAKTGAARSANARIEAARIDAAMIEDTLKADIVRTLNTLRVAQQRHKVARLAVVLAEEAVGNEKKAQAAGESRLLDVLTRQDELAQAKLDVVRAELDIRLAHVRLQRLTGRLLASNHITLR